MSLACCHDLEIACLPTHRNVHLQQQKKKLKVNSICMNSATEIKEQINNFVICFVFFNVNLQFVAIFCCYFCLLFKLLFYFNNKTHNKTLRPSWFKITRLVNWMSKLLELTITIANTIYELMIVGDKLVTLNAHILLTHSVVRNSLTYRLLTNCIFLFFIISIDLKSFVYNIWISSIPSSISLLSSNLSYYIGFIF